MGAVSFSAFLSENGICTPADIEQAQTIQSEYGGAMGSILLNLGSITADELLRAYARYYEYPLFSVYDKESIAYPQIEEVAKSFFIENDIYPLCAHETALDVALNDPNKLDTIIAIQNLTNKELVIYLASAEELRAIKEAYNVEEVEDEDTLDLFEDEVDRLKEMASEAPVIKLVNHIFSKAVEAQVSDIHFESFKVGMKVRFRKDGILSIVERISESLKPAVIARLKLISKMNISENRLSQDGRISIKIAKKELDMRASSIPTAFGESFVLRILDKEAINFDLDDMGIRQPNVALLKSLLKKPNGILLTTGPTGSGKTSTLYASLNHIYSETTKIITVEDPIEYQLEGINQIQVKANIDFTFAKALRSILRQDPDIIMIGEIRDAETANIAIQSALTGHLVLSTLHTNSALGAISRLLDMGMEYFLLKSSIIGLMAQRLIRRLCPECKEPISLDGLEYDFRKLTPHAKTLTPCKAVGCAHCNHTGYKGRTSIMEIVEFSESLQKHMDTNPDFNDLSQIGALSLLEDGLIKFLEGESSFEEVIRVAGWKR